MTKYIFIFIFAVFAAVSVRAAEDPSLIDLFGEEEVKQAEKELREGKASAQVVLHYLKLGSTKERLEREKLEQETSLVKAKTKAYQSADELKEMYKDAIKAMGIYSGEVDEDE